MPLVSHDIFLLPNLSWVELEAKFSLIIYSLIFKSNLGPLARKTRVLASALQRFRQINTGYPEAI